VVDDAWNLSTNVYVGKATSGNTMIITNGGSLVNVGFSYVGYEESSDNNEVVLTGPLSRWTSNGLQLGVQGSYNSLSILNGAKFTGSSGYYSCLGNNYRSAYNSMLVDGVGSEWTAQLISMADGHHNDITVSGGAKVTGNWSLILGARATGDYNTFTAEGDGTQVDIDDDICMGIYWWDWRRGDGIRAMGVGSELSVLSGARCSTGGTVMNWNMSKVEVGERAVVSAQVYSMNSNSDLIFECASDPADSGKLDMSSTVTLAGDLIVKAASGASFSSGYSADLIDGTISGTFSSITLPPLPAHLSWDTSLLYSDGIISIPGMADSDSDQIADPWEVEHFGSIGACEPSVDTDGDGHDNYCEFVAGTDPKVKASCLSVTLGISGSDCVINWVPVENRVYSLEWTPNISHTPFTSVEGGMVYPKSSVTDASNPSGMGFYRMRVGFK